MRKPIDFNYDTGARHDNAPLWYLIAACPCCNIMLAGLRFTHMADGAYGFVPRSMLRKGTGRDQVLECLAEAIETIRVYQKQDRGGSQDLEKLLIAVKMFNRQLQRTPPATVVEYEHWE